MSRGRIVTMLCAAERVLRESGSMEGIRAEEIVRRMVANGCSVPNLTANSLYSAVGADMRARTQRGAPQRFDRPGIGNPSAWTISLAPVATRREPTGLEEPRQHPATPPRQAALPPSSSEDEPGYDPIGGDPVSAPPSPPYAASPVAPAKDRKTAALLSIFLGGVGAHRFYVGKSRTAIVQAALVAGGFMLTSHRAFGEIGDIGAVAALGGAIWVIVDLINILRGRFTDATGVRLGRRVEQAVRDTEQSVLRAVKSLGGLAGPTELALRTGLTIDEAKEHLESLVERGHAQHQIRKNGSLTYTIPDLLSDEKRVELEEF